MKWDLALHTMVSFLTNTNQQHYSGQSQLSYLSQMVGIVGLQMITPMMGLAMLAATLEYWQYDTFIARWDDRGIEPAYVTFALDASGKVSSISMKPVSPLADFSFDFQDLVITPQQ